MTAVLRFLAELGWKLAADFANWLLGPPPPPGTTCPPRIPSWVLEECADLLPDGWDR